jgi:enoyl-CoA hydratase/carnithine racemase
MDAARELAATLLGASPSSLMHMKRVLCKFAAEEVDRELERAIAENAGIRATTDFREGLTAFLEKRKPAWQGK